METTIQSLGVSGERFRVKGLGSGFRVSGGGR